MRLVIVAHAVTAGIRGEISTHNSLWKHFTLSDLRETVQSIIQSLVLCAPSKIGKKIPRRLSPIVHAQKHNYVVYFDYFPGDIEDSQKCMLVVNYFRSGYFQIDPTSSETSTHTVEVLVRWKSILPSPNVWV